jgi:FAD/FMN-containing dehydrogenase
MSGSHVTRESAPWQNWSGSQRHRATVLTPRGTGEVVAAVRAAARDGMTVRCAGSAHSFVPFWTDDVILSLDQISGVRSVNRERQEAAIAAGTKLHALGPLLWAQGLSLPQQGDIDRQSLAGALSTGTHGTGRQLPNLSAYVQAVTLVMASGDVRTLTAADGDPFLAACLGLGSLGVMVEAILALEPAFNLHERNWVCDIETCAAQLGALIEGNRHFEFFWTPRTDRFDMKTLNKTAAPAAQLGDGEYVAPAFEAFPSEREIRFNEMEYSVPYERGWECFLELRAMMLASFPQLPWPVEFRTLAADDRLLSTANGRETVTLSVHQGAERDWRELFGAAEAIFRNHHGRPHWGKLHGLTAPDLERLCPGLEAFRRVRAELDPGGRFLNGYLKRLLNA